MDRRNSALLSRRLPRFVRNQLRVLRHPPTMILTASSILTETCAISNWCLPSGWRGIRSNTLRRTQSTTYRTVVHSGLNQPISQIRSRVHMTRTRKTRNSSELPTRNMLGKPQLSTIVMGKRALPGETCGQRNGRRFRVSSWLVDTDSLATLIQITSVTSHLAHGKIKYMCCEFSLNISTRPSING